MMVSAYFCISDPKVCPVRAKFLGSHVPVNDSLSSLDEFVIRGQPAHVIDGLESACQYLYPNRAE